uniref:Uncharacterized protein n=1 Tax=Neogobius melanostomus TaxID=47308 RepID=A0A8C6S992_9GOBI
MAALRQRYVVSRPVYSEDTFEENYERIVRIRKTTKDHVKDLCSFCVVS